MLKTTAKILLFLHIFKYFFIKKQPENCMFKKNAVSLCVFLWGDILLIYIIWKTEGLSAAGSEQ